jgi:hypothetical protein
MKYCQEGNFSHFQPFLAIFSHFWTFSAIFSQYLKTIQALNNKSNSKRKEQKMRGSTLAKIIKRGKLNVTQQTILDVFLLVKEPTATIR